MTDETLLRDDTKNSSSPISRHIILLRPADLPWKWKGRCAIESIVILCLLSSTTYLVDLCHHSQVSALAADCTSQITIHSLLDKKNENDTYFVESRQLAFGFGPSCFLPNYYCY